MFSLATTYSLVLAYVMNGHVTGTKVMGIYNTAQECSQAQSHYPKGQNQIVGCCRSDAPSCIRGFTNLLPNPLP